MDRFPNIAETLAFVLEVWIFGQREAAHIAGHRWPKYDVDPTIDTDLYLDIFGLDP